MASYNKREGKEAGAGKVQRGGTATLLREELTACVTTYGVDPIGLGRWSWYLLEGEEGYQIRVVTAYAPCVSAASNTETYYQQQARYIVEKALKTNLHEMFWEDLLIQLRKWRIRGDRMILVMDTNKDVTDGAMYKQPHKADLNMKGVVFSQTRIRGPKTYFRGSVAIADIWVSEELEVTAAAYLLFDPELGNH